ncbi:hypothetical protein FPV67DRAFT_431470 [Lyophyllum atratum]|nr:hypothetical protein FPV67DRAFT_431470 [Lyophyllum atratum]
MARSLVALFSGLGHILASFGETGACTSKANALNVITGLSYAAKPEIFGTQKGKWSGVDSVPYIFGLQLRKNAVTAKLQSGVAREHDTAYWTLDAYIREEFWYCFGQVPGRSSADQLQLQLSNTYGFIAADVMSTQELVRLQRRAYPTLCPSNRTWR